MFGQRQKTRMPTKETALPGRDMSMPVPVAHFILNTPMQGPWPDDMEMAMFGLGCFWGAERKFWQMDGVYSTQVGYAAGLTPNPSYEEVCSGGTGHNEVVQVIYDPKIVSFEALLSMFWESHNPTQGMRQGNDVGSTYRSGIYAYTPEQMAAAEASKTVYQEALRTAGRGAITTEVLPAPVFYYAEDYHQQYLAKNPGGYCGIGGTGVSCPIGTGVRG